MNDNKPRYRATHVTDSSSYDATRGAHRTKQVHYMLQDGTRSYVELPHDQYTPDNVQSALENAAATHEQVMSIQPGVPTMNTDASGNPWGGQ